MRTASTMGIRRRGDIGRHRPTWEATSADLGRCGNDIGRRVLRADCELAVVATSADFGTRMVAHSMRYSTIVRLSAARLLNAWSSKGREAVHPSRPGQQAGAPLTQTLALALALP